MEKLTLTYLKKEFYLDGFLEMLKKKEIKKFNDLNYLILTVCSFGRKNYDILIKQLYDVKSNFYITWDELRRSGELIPKLSNNFKLSYQKEEGYGQHEFNTSFLTCHILKSKIDKLYYLTSYFIDLDDSNCMPEYSILNSFKSLKDAKKSSSTILKKFKTKGVYPSTTWLKKWNNEEKTMKNKDNSFFASFTANTPLYKLDEFVNGFRKKTVNKNKFYLDVKLSKDGHKVFISNSKDDFV